MICPYCGSALEDNADFCANCGMFLSTPKKPEPKKSSFSDAEPENDVLKNLFSPAQPEALREEFAKKKKKAVPKQAKLILFAVVIVLALLLVLNFIRGLGRRRGIAGIGEPIQTEATGYTEKSIAGYDVSIYYQYAYEIEALVVHTKRYYGLGLASKLAPVDLGLAWGTVAEYNDKIDFHWRQSGRWIHWRVKNFDELAPVGYEGGVNSQCSNNHIIPADSSVKRKVKKIKRGDHVKLSGYLVNVDAENKSGKVFLWDSSTTRYDSGDGACEVFYVTDVIWLD